MYGNTELVELIDALASNYENHNPQSLQDQHDVVSASIIDVMGIDRMNDEGLREWCFDYIVDMIEPNRE